MPQFTVDEDLAALVEKLAKPKPFENLSFNSALRRVLTDLPQVKDDLGQKKLDRLVAAARERMKTMPKKAPSPSPERWLESVPELKMQRHLSSWKAVCDYLGVDTAGDSARRRLRNWVKVNKPSWPQVPSVEGD